jgi:anaerobic selenocysteine-containing dehydrogenase
MPVVRGACPHDCPDTCSWHVTVEEGRATKLVGDPDHPFTHGGLCAKVNSFLEDRTYNPDRLLYPMRRTGPKGAGEFARCTWQEAIAGIAGRLREVIAQHGAEAVLPYSYIGTQGMVQGMAMHQRFFTHLGAARLERTVCGDNGSAGLTASLGTSAGIDPELIEHARLIILWGTNTVITNLHLWPFVQRARKAGARVVVIDPVRTRTAQAADVHLAPRPGTDAALALGLMHVMLAEGLEDRDYVARHTVGVEELRERAADYPPERVAAITGLEAEQIVALARDYATTRPAVIRTLVGMEHRRNGAMTFRAISCLPALTGAWRDLGGGLVGMTGPRLATKVRMERLAPPDADTREVNMLEIGRALTELEPPVHALVVYSGNPTAQAPNQNAVLAGLAREDLFVVVHEHFMTDAALYADYLLPATTQVEQLDLMYSWGHLYLALNQPAIEPRGEAVSNSELFRRLAAALGLDHPDLRESDEEIIRSLLDNGDERFSYEHLLEAGWAKVPMPDRPFADGGFPTPSGCCELYAADLVEQGLDPLPAYEAVQGKGTFPLALVAAKGELHFLNSSYGGVARHLRAAGEPLLELSEADAAARGIADGDPVRIFNALGEVLARARLGDRVRPGVVAMPSGWWASRSPGGRSVNAVTSDGVAPWGRGGDFHDTWVEVARVTPPANGARPAAEALVGLSG